MIFIIGGLDLYTKEFINTTEILLISNNNENAIPILLHGNDENISYFLNTTIGLNLNSIRNSMPFFSGISAMSAAWLNSEEYEIVVECIGDNNMTNRISNTFVIIGGSINGNSTKSQNIFAVDVEYEETDRPKCRVANKSNFSVLLCLV